MSRVTDITGAVTYTPTSGIKRMWSVYEVTPKRRTWINSFDSEESAKRHQEYMESKLEREKDYITLGPKTDPNATYEVSAKDVQMYSRVPDGTPSIWVAYVDDVGRDCCHAEAFFTNEPAVLAFIEGRKQERPYEDWSYEQKPLWISGHEGLED